MASAAPPAWSKGCEHYKRSCKLVAPCCDEVFSCRFCHDEKRDHTLNRFQVANVVCVRCARRQSVKLFCERCGMRFGKYVCLICNLFDDEDKGQFHCMECGICRIGGKRNYFHCDKCNMCLALRLIGNHKCIENASRGGCPVCLEDIHTSRISAFVPPCGHLLHENCHETLKKSGRVTCPVCQKNY